MPTQWFLEESERKIKAKFSRILVRLGGIGTEDMKRQIQAVGAIDTGELLASVQDSITTDGDLKISFAGHGVFVELGTRDTPARAFARTTMDFLEVELKAGRVAERLPKGGR